MEKLIVDVFGKYAIIIVPFISGVVCSFIIEGINRATSDKVKGVYITTGTCVVIGVLFVFGFPSVITGWFDKVIAGALNVSVALGFYHLGGKKIYEALLGKAVKKAESLDI